MKRPSFVRICAFFLALYGIFSTFALKSEAARVYRSVSVDPGKKQVALTFDDGPHPRLTLEILSILEEYGVKATFFVIGTDEPENLERMRRIVREGHTIGMHSYTHDYSVLYGSVEGFLGDFYKNFCQRDSRPMTFNTSRQ